MKDETTKQYIKRITELEAENTALLDLVKALREDKKRLVEELMKLSLRWKCE